MSYTLEPLADFLFVIPDAPERMSAGGLHLPETTERPPLITGVIVAAGQGCTHVKEGERVMFGIHAGNPVTVSGVFALLVREAHCVGILREKLIETV